MLPLWNGIFLGHLISKKQLKYATPPPNPLPICHVMDKSGNVYA